MDTLKRGGAEAGEGPDPGRYTSFQTLPQWVGAAAATCSKILSISARRKTRPSLLVNVSAACYVWPTHVNVDRAVASSSFTEPPEERLMAQVEAQRGPRSYVFLLFLPLLVTVPRFIAAAQRNFPPGHFLFRTYAGTQGLGNLAIGHLVQDSEGFIWAGTEDGLYRYDGSHFQRYDARQGLPSDWITSLHVAPDRTLWVGTTHGVARRSGRGFVPVPVMGGAAGLAPEWIMTGAGGRLWIATPRGPVSQRLDGSFEIVAGWPGGEASALWARSDESSVFVARAGETESPVRGSVYEWDRGRWRELDGTGEFGRERIDALARDRDGNLWGRTVQRLWVLPAGAARFEPSVRELPPCTSRGYIDAGSRGDLWFPTNHGLYHQDGGVWSSVTVETGLPTSWARAAMVDREGSLWVASDGLHRLLGRGYWTAYTLKEGLTSEAVRTVFRDRAHRLWVGCDAGLLRAAPDRFELVPGTERCSIRSIIEGPDGSIYAAGSPPGILVLRNGTISRIGAHDGIIGKRVLRLLMDSAETLWVATDSAGLLRGVEKSGKWRFMREDLPYGVSQEVISDLHLDAAGRLWAAGSEGLAVLEDNRWRRFTRLDGLRSTHVACVSSTKAGELLVSYVDASGLMRASYRGAGLQVRGHLEEGEDLGGGKVYLMGEDRQGRLWVGTGRGVDVIEGASSEHFGAGDGLVGEDCASMAFLAEETGDVWIGTSAGLALFDGRNYRRPRPPLVTILRAQLGREEVDVPAPQSLVVPWRRNSLGVEFAGMTFVHEEAVGYQVRLDSIDTDWQSISTRGARYPALPAGEYAFEVRARIDRGAWGPAASFGFEVQAAWWETLWWRGPMILAFLLAIGAGIRWRQRSLRRRNEELEESVKARTAELAQLNAQLQELSLTDPLTLLHNRRYIAATMPDESARLVRIHEDIQSGRVHPQNDNIHLVFIMVDVDHFKNVNDEHGHGVGDRVLQQLAAILRRACRKSDLLVRWGGEEFLLVGRNSSRAGAALLAERIRAAVESAVFDAGDGLRLHCTCSLGYASFPFAPRDPASLAWERVVDVADYCLLAAKRSGRNGWVGLAASDNLDAIDVQEINAESTPELVRAGSLHVDSSFADTASLEWQ